MRPNKPERIDREETARVILRRLNLCARPYVFRISWCMDLYSAFSIRHFASAFALKIGNNLFGVTAAHVIRGCLADQQSSGRLFFCVGDQDIELDVIDSGNGIDVATFALKEELLRKIGKTPLAYRPEQWPPNSPTAGAGIILAGYPRDWQRVIDMKNVEMHQVSNRLVIEQVEISNLTMRIWAKFHKSIDGEPMPDLSADVGGYSGAPILVESTSVGQLFDCGGVLYEGILRERDGDRFVEFKAEPARRIRSNGRLSYSVV